MAEGTGLGSRAAADQHPPRCHSPRAPPQLLRSEVHSALAPLPVAAAEGSPDSAPAAADTLHVSLFRFSLGFDGGDTRSEEGSDDGASSRGDCRRRRRRRHSSGGSSRSRSRSSHNGDRHNNNANAGGEGNSSSDGNGGGSAGGGSTSGAVDVDSDGDLHVVRRRRRPRRTARGGVVRIQHAVATDLDSVGLQVWGAALLLGDFILSRPGLFRGKVVVELGAGPGLSGLVAARFARRVYLTDHLDAVLYNAQANVDLQLQQQQKQMRQPLLQQQQQPCQSTRRHRRCHQHCGVGYGSDVAAVSVASGGQSPLPGGHVSQQPSAAAQRPAPQKKKRRPPSPSSAEAWGAPPPPAAAAAAVNAPAVVLVRRLDWFQPSVGRQGASASAVGVRADAGRAADSTATPAVATAAAATAAATATATAATVATAFAMSDADLAAVACADVFLAADVVYDDDLTDAFFDTLRALLLPSGGRGVSGGGGSSGGGDGGGNGGGDGGELGRCCWLSVCRRLNFSVAARRVVATGYACLLQHLGRADLWRAERVPVGGVPRGFEGYDRTEFLELWCIRPAGRRGAAAAASASNKRTQRPPASPHALDPPSRKQ